MPGRKKSTIAGSGNGCNSGRREEQSRHRRLAELGPVDHTAEILQALAEQQPNLETALDEPFFV